LAFGYARFLYTACFFLFSLLHVFCHFILHFSRLRNYFFIKLDISYKKLWCTFARLFNIFTFFSKVLWPLPEKNVWRQNCAENLMAETDMHYNCIINMLQSFSLSVRNVSFSRPIFINIFWHF
jgi:hypothetical protein